MSYTKQNFQPNAVLTAAQLNAMDNQIYDNAEDIGELKEDLSELGKQIGFDMSGVQWENKGLHTTTIGEIATKEVNAKRAITNKLMLPIGITLSSDTFFINLVRIDENEIIIAADDGWTSKERTTQASGTYYIIIANDPTTDNVNISDIDVHAIGNDDSIVEIINNKIDTIQDEIGKDESILDSLGIGGISTVVGRQVTIESNNKRAYSEKMYLRKGVELSSDKMYINRISVDENDVIIAFDSGWTAQSRVIETTGFYRLIMRNLTDTAITEQDLIVEKRDLPTNIAARLSRIESKLNETTHAEQVKKITRQKNYEAWSKAMYDYEKRITLIAYASGVDHAYVNKDIKICIEKDGLYTVKTVANGDSTISLKPICIYKKNGIYTIFATYAEGMVDSVKKVIKYTSNDLETWSATEISFPFQDIEGSINIDNVSEVNGRLFTNLTYYTNNRSFVCYSDDDGDNWEIVELDYDGAAPCEMIYFEVQNKIVMLARKGIPNETDKQPLYISFSDDNGETWSELENTNGITDANASNLSAIRFGDNSMLIVYGSRHSGTAGIYCSVTKYEDVLSNNFAEPTKLIDGLSNGNFGYPYVFRKAMDIYFTYYSAENASDSTTASIILCKLICPNDNIINALNDILKI